MNEIFAQNLKSLRKQHNLSQQELADHLNVHIGSITKWEKSGVRPRTQKINEIAEFFNISPDELRGAKLTSDGARKRLSKTELKKHKTIGQKLKALREHFDMNFTELANEIGTSSYTVSKWEKEISKPYSDVLLRLSDFFGVDYEELAGEPRKTNPIGERIRALRAENNMTRDQLSEQLGMSTQSIHSWEQGKTIPRSRALDKLAAIFNVSQESIFSQKEHAFDTNFFTEEAPVHDSLVEEIIEFEAVNDQNNLLDEETMRDEIVETPIVPEPIPAPAAFEAKILEFNTPATTPSRPEPVSTFVPVAISKENEIIDLEVLFTSANKRLVIGDSLLTQEERERAINVLSAIFQK